jgi:hypothetical protein
MYGAIHEGTPREINMDSKDRGLEIATRNIQASSDATKVIEYIIEHLFSLLILYAAREVINGIIAKNICHFILTRLGL